MRPPVDNKNSSAIKMNDFSAIFFHFAKSSSGPHWTLWKAGCMFDNPDQSYEIALGPKKKKKKVSLQTYPFIERDLGP